MHTPTYSLSNMSAATRMLCGLRAQQSLIRETAVAEPEPPTSSTNARFLLLLVMIDADVKEELNTYAISGHMKSGHANKLNVEDTIRVSINSVCSTYGNKYRLSKNVPPCTPKAKFRRAY